jgi:hypothetical protein
MKKHEIVTIKYQDVDNPHLGVVVKTYRKTADVFNLTTLKLSEENISILEDTGLDIRKVVNAANENWIYQIKVKR